MVDSGLGYYIGAKRAAYASGGGLTTLNLGDDAGWSYVYSAKIFIASEIWNSTLNSAANPGTTQITLGSTISYKGNGELSGVSVQHNFYTDTTVTTAGSLLMKVSNNATEKFSIDKDGLLNIPGGQVGDSGLIAGQTYFDTAL